MLCAPGMPPARDTSPRDPQRGVLHRLLREHLETFLSARAATDPDGVGLPAFVANELRAYHRARMSTEHLIPADVRAALDAAKAANARVEAGDESAYAEADAAIDRACDLVGIPRQDEQQSLPLVLPASLSPVQRATLAYAAANDVGLGPSFRVPALASELRAWLGLGDAALLDATEVDLGEGPVSLRTALRANALRAIDALPLDVALRVIGELAHHAQLGIALSNPFQNGVYRLCTELRDEGREWALAQVDALEPKTRGSVRDAVVLFALVRAGVPLSPRWAQLGWALHHVWRSELEAVVRAIPAPDRPEWLAQAARAGRWANDILSLAPSVALAEAQLSSEQLYSSRWRWLVGKMIELGKSHPELAAFAAQKQAEAPEPLTLAVTRILAPKSAEELTELEREQLRLATRGYDEQDVDAAARLADDGSETSFHGHVVVRSIASEKGAPLYDAYTYLDGGAFFRAGTTEEIAWVAQGGVVLKEKNESLRQALGVAIGPNAIVKRATKVASKKKPAEKRAPAKKTKKS